MMQSHGGWSWGQELVILAETAVPATMPVGAVVRHTRTEAFMTYSAECSNCHTDLALDSPSHTSRTPLASRTRCGACWYPCFVRCYSF